MSNDVERLSEAVRAVSRRLRKLESQGGAGRLIASRTVTDTTPPDAPTGLRLIIATDTTAMLAWNAATDNVTVTQYEVYQDGAAISSVSMTSYTVSGLSPSTTYQFQVAAVDAAGNRSPLSSILSATTAGPVPDTQAPTTPNGLMATDIQATEVSLTWNASSDNVGVAGYTVYRNGVPIATTAQHAYLDTGLTPSTPYTYAVAAFDDAANQSGQSAAIIVNTPALPAANTWYVATNGSGSNPGTIDLPLSLDRALNGGHAGAIQAGHTVYLLDGAYDLTTAQIVTGLSGASGNPIVFRPYPGARPRIRNNGGTIHHALELRNVANVDFYDIEFTAFNYTRSPALGSQSAASHIYENPSYTQTNVRWLDCKLHDCAGPAVRSAPGSTGIVYGECLFYYNGSAPAHDWTAWILGNDNAGKTLRDCALIHNAADDVRVYTADTTPARDALIEGNLIVASGSLYANPARGILVAGVIAQPVGVSLRRNVTYNRATPDADSRSVQLGHLGTGTSGSYNSTGTDPTSDGRFGADGTTFNATASILQIGLASGPVDMSGWVRWTTTIPQGAIITSAVLNLRATNAEPAATVYMRIRAEAADNPASITTAADAIARARTSANVAWTISNWAVGALQSPDFAAVVQEVVNRPGWLGDLQIFLDEDSSLSTNDIWFAAREHLTETPAEIIVQYTTGSGDAGIANLSMQDNTLIGQPADLDGGGYSGVTVVNNTFAYTGAHIGNTQTRWPSNTYTSSYPTVSVGVITRPFTWDNRRGWILILNWPGSASVTVTAAQLSGFAIQTGDNYELRNCENYYSDRIVGNFNGTSITVPMTGRSQATPAGGLAAPVSLFPTVGLFQIVVSGAGGGGGGDTTPPTAPTGLSGDAGSGSVVLTWNPSTDAAGVKEYRVYRNGLLLATTPHTTPAPTGGTNGDPQPQPGDFYIAANGSSSNSGSSSSPWSMAYALNGGAGGQIGPGDTVWIRAGTYTLNIEVNLQGTLAQPIRVCAYPGEEGSISIRSVTVEGSTWTMNNVQHTHFYNLVFNWINYDRSVKNDAEQPNGSCVQDQTTTIKTGVKWRGCHYKNALGQGYRSRGASHGAGWSWEGCHFYYNGAGRYDHGLYCWNNVGTTTLIEKCLFHMNAGHDIHGYNTGPVSEDDYDIHRNVFWQMGGLYSNNRSRAILVADDANDTNDNRITNNLVYSNLTNSTYHAAIKVGYVDNGWFNNLIEDNLFVGTATSSPYLQIDLSATPQSGNTVRNNRFLGCTAVGASRTSFPNNTWAAVPTSGNEAFVHAYSYNTQKGNVVIYNWASASAVTVSHAQLTGGGLNIASGDGYILHNSENFFGDTISGTYNGASISFPMTGRTMEAPIGCATPSARSAFPTFGAWVIEVIKSGTPGSAQQTYTDAAVVDGQTYQYQVAAVDVYDNASALSSSITVTV